MRNRIYLYALLLLVVLKSSCMYGQASSDEKQIIGMLKSFYTEYMTTLSKDDVRLSVKKIHSLQKTYCTQKLLKKLPMLSEQIDADPFLQAQDSNIDYIKTLSIVKSQKIFNQYIVSYIDIYSPNKIKVIIYLTIVKEKNGFKIDSIKW